MTADTGAPDAHDSHGQSFSAWLVVLLLITASVFATLGVWLADWVMFTGAMVMVPLALLIGLGLSALRRSHRQQAPPARAPQD